jgi:hypothetical protein
MLKDKEKLAAEIIKNEFSIKYANVSYTEGEDPPDIHLEYDSKKVAIELTELSSNLYKGRISVDKAYEGFIKNIKIDIPDYTSYLVVFHHANIKLNKKRKKDIENFLKKPNTEMQKCINGISVKINSKTIKPKTGTIDTICFNQNRCNRDMNAVSESQMDFNIEYVFISMVNKAIETKKEKCKDIVKPIWLAMHDSYFDYFFSQSKDQSVELYKKTINTIDFGIFEKMIITFKDKGIIVFDRETT